MQKLYRRLRMWLQPWLRRRWIQLRRCYMFSYLDVIVWIHYDFENSNLIITWFTFAIRIRTMRVKSNSLTPKYYSFISFLSRFRWMHRSRQILPRKCHLFKHHRWLHMYLQPRLLWWRKKLCRYYIISLLSLVIVLHH